MDWNDLRYFLALARHGSVRAAGADLGVSHSTVARRVDALEGKLGTRLFDRHRDGYVLTEAGERMLPAAERVEDDVWALARNVAGRDEQLAGTVHITCSDEYVADQVLGDLHPWCAAHPDVEVAMTTDGRLFNLAKGEADLAIRASPRHAMPPEYLVARKLAPVSVASYVARSHADALTPPSPGARWLAFDDSRQVDALVDASSFPELPRWGAFASLRLMVRATARGLGLGMLPTYAGDAEPALQRLPVADVRHVGDLWLLYHPDLRDTARIQAVRAIIRDGFSRRRALYEGRCEDEPQRLDSGP